MAAVGLYKPYLFLRFALPIRECVREKLDGYSFDHCRARARNRLARGMSPRMREIRRGTGQSVGRR